MGWNSLRWHLGYTGQSVQSKEALVTVEWIHGTHYSFNRAAWTWQGEGPEVLNHFFLDLKLRHVWIKSSEKDVSNHCVLGVGCRAQGQSSCWTFGSLDCSFLCACLCFFVSCFLSLARRQFNMEEAGWVVTSSGLALFSRQWRCLSFFLIPPLRLKCFDLVFKISLHQLEIKK